MVISIPLNIIKNFNTLDSCLRRNDKRYKNYHETTIMKTIHIYYVYILTSQRNGTIYIGMTNDLKRRVYEHKTGIKKGFTQKYGVSMLVYFEEFQQVEQAIEREHNMKKWKRNWKLKLIEEDNPYWNDLAKDWYDDILTD